jgi:hypothetical protein
MKQAIYINSVRHGGRHVDSQEGLGDWNQWGIVTGALVGAFAGYLLTTPHGRRVCDAAVQLLEDFSVECLRFSQASARAQMAAAEGWKAIEGTFDGSRTSANH